MKRRIFAVLMLIVLAFGLVSCSGASSDYDEITSVFVRRLYEQEDVIGTFNYDVRYSDAEKTTVLFNGLNRNADGSITELTNYEVDEQVLEEARQICRKNDAISKIKDGFEITQDNYTGVFYTVTLQFSDGTELSIEIPGTADWIDELVNFFVAKGEELVTAL